MYFHGGTKVAEMPHPKHLEAERKLHEAMGGPMRRALANRRYLDAHWSQDPAALSAVVAETWIAFPAYGRPKS